MYTVMANVGLRKGLISEGPCLLLSMLIAEVFYKFHSFSLECLALLATWFVVSYLASLSRRVWKATQNT